MFEETAQRLNGFIRTYEIVSPSAPANEILLIPRVQYGHMLSSRSDNPA